MKKALVLASVASMIEQFNMPNIHLLQEMGYEVHVACNFEKGSTCSDEKIKILKNTLIELNVTFYQIDFARNVAKIDQNFHAYKQVKKIVTQNHYDLIHCHSPIGGLVARLAASKERKHGTKVIYTAHGFHFYKGAPRKNWILYYTVEKVCSYFTDVLITINQEDFALAQKKMEAQQKVYLPGVGINLQKFSRIDGAREKKRKELGIPENSILLLSVGELNANKNHEIVLKAIADKDVYYVIAGRGALQEYLQNIIDELGMKNRVKLLGFRSDVKELYDAADVFVFPSYREGLSVSLMEAMGSGLPCAVSKIRGNTDLVDENGGTLFEPQDVESCKKAITKLLDSNRKAMSQYNIEKIKSYSIENVMEQTKKIYSDFG